MTIKLNGLYTAIITPFSSGSGQSIDNKSLSTIIEHQISAVVSGIVVLGSTGESSVLSNGEHDKMIETTLDMIGGRTTVIAGTGANSTSGTIRTTKHAAEAGVDAALIITPSGNKPPQRGLIAHFMAVAEAVDIPIILYNIPSRTGVYVEPDTIIELSKHQNIIGVKDASSQFNDINKVINETDDNFYTLSGNDNETIKIMRLGGVGSIAVTSNAIPVEIKAFVDTCLSGDWANATKLNARYADLYNNLFTETNPIPIKALMSHLGYCKNELRLPLVEMNKHLEKKLITSYSKLKI